MAERNRLTLRLLTPQGIAAEIACSRVRLELSDDAQGHGGGSVGILPGHLPALMALEAGRIIAARSGSETFTAQIGQGIARVEGDIVTVLTDAVEL